MKKEQKQHLHSELGDLRAWWHCADFDKEPIERQEYSFIILFIHSLLNPFDKYLLGKHYVLITVLWVNKADFVSHLHGVWSGNKKR